MNTRKELIQEFMLRAKQQELQPEVMSDGAINSHIAIVGEAPGVHEVATKIPFSGGAGNILWSNLRPIGVSRQNVYITNVVKRQLAQGRDKDKSAITRGELSHWEELVRWELGQLPNLRFVLLLGNHALKAFTGESGITKWRGSVFEGEVGGNSVHFVCAYNPAMVARDPTTSVVFKFDIKKLNRVMAGKYTPYIIEPIINPSPRESIQWCEKMIDERKPVSFDIETLANETACVGMTNDTHTGMCINFRDAFSNRFTVKEEYDVRKAINRVLTHKDTKLVAQNGTFDSYWLAYRDRIVPNPIWFDTLLAHHTLYPTLPHDLGFLTTQYTDHPYYKDEKAAWREQGNIDKFWNYNVKDCCLTLSVQRRLLTELREQGLSDFFFDHVMALQPHLIRATILGVRADTELKEHLVDATREDVAKLVSRFHELVHEATGEPDYSPNPNSPQQLKQLFFWKLKLVGRGVSTNKENRERMKKHPHTSAKAKEIIDTLDTYSKENKFLTTYAESKIDEDNRVRCEYKQFGTQAAPGRLSSSAVMWGSGMNLQNQPPRAQTMFVADPGYCFVYFDLSQAEARYVAWDAWIETWIEQFERARRDGSYDAHRALASDLFNKPYDEVPSKDLDKNGVFTIRYIAKRSRYGLNYCMQADRLATITGLPMATAQMAFDVYHRKHPELKVWWNRLSEIVSKERRLYNSFGRRLIFLQRLSDEGVMDSIVAFRPQSTIGDKVCRVWKLAEQDRRWPRHARICLNVHDALIGLAPISQAKTCLRIMKQYVEEPIPVKSVVTGETHDMIIPAETKLSYATSWKYEDGKLVFYADKQGLHRWSHMEEVEIAI